MTPPPAPQKPTPANPSGPRPLDALPPGTRFGEFEILGVIGMGGFGVVYLAQDHSLERQVALKEYMPTSLAVRGEGPSIHLRSQSLDGTYAAGLRSFVNEARMLARFDHPSLLKVFRFWEDNGTAYMVMPYLQGSTLSQTRRAMAQPPTEAWIRSILGALLDALEHLHANDVFHRDVAPDNIFLPRSGPPVLLDFGAARRVIVDRTQALTAILKPSYAPIEQYAEMSAMRQGPWTDLYALGAVMHFLVFGQPPMPSTSRAVQPDAVAIEDKPAPHVSRHFLQVLGWMLAVRPQERPQSVMALRDVLAGHAEVPGARTHGVRLGQADEQPSRAEPTVPDRTPYSEATQLDTRHQPTQWQPRRDAAPPPAGEGAPLRAVPPGETPPVHVPTPKPTPEAQPVIKPLPANAQGPAPAVAASRPTTGPNRRALVWGTAGAVLGLAVLGGWWQWRAPRAPSAAAAVAAPAASAAPSAGYRGPNLGEVASVPAWGK